MTFNEACADLIGSSTQTFFEFAIWRVANKSACESNFVLAILDSVSIPIKFYEKSYSRVSKSLFPSPKNSTSFWVKSNCENEKNYSALQIFSFCKYSIPVTFYHKLYRIHILSSILHNLNFFCIQDWIFYI